MDSTDNSTMEIDNITISPVTEKVDLVYLELLYEKLSAELKMKKAQVEELRQQEDSQNVKIHELKMNLNTAQARVSELEFELDLTKKKCLAIQSKIMSTIPQKTIYDKLVAENESLKEILQKSEFERKQIQRKYNDLMNEIELQASNKNLLIEQENKFKERFEEMRKMFATIETESAQVKNVLEKLQQMKDNQHCIGTYKKLAADAVEKRDKMEEEYLNYKTKFNMLVDLLDKYQLPQQQSIKVNVEHYKQEIQRLKKDLEEEKDLTIRQHARIVKEIAYNVTLCLKLDELEKGIETKCMKDICLQTD